MEKLLHTWLFWLGLSTFFILAWLSLLIPYLKNYRTSYKGVILASGLFATLVFRLYAYWGQSSQIADLKALDQLSVQLTTLSHDHNLSPQTVRATLSALQAKISYSPVALAKLGSIYLELMMYDEAGASFKKAFSLAPTHYDYQVQWIYSYSLKNQGKLPADVRAIAKQLIIDHPEQKAAINILAIDDYFAGNYVSAIHRWEELIAHDATLTTDRKQVLENAIASAKRHLEGNNQTLVSSIVIPVQIDLNPVLKKSIAPNASVFIIVKLADKIGPPLAVIKKSVADLPFKGEVGERHLMLPGSKLQSEMKVEIVAKISPTGDPLSKTGIWQGKSGEIVLKSSMPQINVIIDEKV